MQSCCGQATQLGGPLLREGRRPYVPSPIDPQAEPGAECGGDGASLASWNPDVRATALATREADVLPLPIARSREANRIIRSK